MNDEFKKIYQKKKTKYQKEKNSFIKKNVIDHKDQSRRISEESRSSGKKRTSKFPRI